jgi:hypothetical protein
METEYLRSSTLLEVECMIDGMKKLSGSQAEKKIYYVRNGEEAIRGS